MTEDEYHGDDFAERCDRNISGLKQKNAEANFYGAYEELFVLDNLYRAASNTSPEDMTDERIELIARLAWAQIELINGYADRVPDDLEGVEDLAETVSEQR